MPIYQAPTIFNLPTLTQASNSIVLENSVQVPSGGSTELVVNRDGSIQAKVNQVAAGGSPAINTGIHVQPGGYFWAYKDMVCPPTTFDETIIVETRSASLPPKAITSITPNPFREEFLLNLNLSEQEIVSIVLYNALGKMERIIMQDQEISLGKHQIPVASEELAAGVYYCHIKIGQTVHTESILKIE